MIERIRQQMMRAMKNGEKVKKIVLSSLLAALQLKEKELRKELSDSDAISVIRREVKQAKETIDSVPPDRKDLIDNANATISILSELLPKQLTDEELSDIVQTSAGKTVGEIMRDIIPIINGRADGKRVREFVLKMLDTK